MKKSYLFLILTFVILLVAIVTNPDEVKQKEAVKSKLSAYIKKKAESSGALSSLFADALVQRIVDGIISSDNYLFFSLTKINWKGQSKVIGVGLFSNVIFFSKMNEVAAAGFE